MSGICGLCHENASGTVETLASMTGGLCLGAEDRVAQEIDHNAGVGVASRFETQQLHRDAGLLVACDADLYNEDDLLRAAGERPGDGLTTAALLAALYRRWGPEFVEKLRGAFSLIIWDSQERRMLAAVDGFAIKRLAYYEHNGVLLIGTRINALLRSGHVHPEINPRAIPHLVNYSANIGLETIFRKVLRLAPGTMLLAGERGTRLTTYWDMRYGLDNAAGEARLSQQLASVVEESVTAHSKSVPFDQLGAFLSGGTDSSTLVGMLSRSGRGRARAFSIGFEEHEFNELGYADLAAKHFGAEHHTYLVSADDCFEALPRIVSAYDEPFGNSSAVPTYFCARLAREHGIQTILAGDGGDELFGGNEWYRTEKIFSSYELVPRILRRGLIEPILGRLPGERTLLRKARNYVRRANMPGVERVLSFQFLSTYSPAKVFTSDFLDVLADYSFIEVPARHYSRAPARDHLDRLLYMDLKITLADNDLPKVTCAGELAGVRVRFPFLDRAVAEFSGRIPPSLKVKRLEKRYLFKRAFRDLLPAEIIKKRKHGFGIPVALWLKTHPRLRELSRDTLLSGCAVQRGYFRREFIEYMFRRHAEDESSYYGDTLWTLLMIELWHRQVVDAPVEMAV